jgi:hypothetical protein
MNSEQVKRMSWLIPVIRLEILKKSTRNLCQVNSSSVNMLPLRRKCGEHCKLNNFEIYFLKKLFNINMNLFFYKTYRLRGLKYKIYLRIKSSYLYLMKIFWNFLIYI